MIHVEVDGKTVLGFDTGLNSRSFAQAKFAQFITEPGLIVSGGNVELWKASGVVETGGASAPSTSSGTGVQPAAEPVEATSQPTMVVWGPSFEGEPLDLLLNESNRQDEKLTAVIRWIQAILLLEKYSYSLPPLWPCAAIIGEDGIFFAPPSLTLRCMMTVEETARFSGRYVNNGLYGMDGAAFTAAAMLYRIFTGTPPFPEADDSLLYQDMQDAHFLPIRFAVPGLDAQLAALIQNALNPMEKRTGSAIKGITILNEIIAILQDNERTVSAASLVQPLSEENSILLEKEKKQFLKITATSIKTKRFIMRNASILIACLAALVVIILVGYSMAQSRALLPSTAGMEPAEVIESYYNAFGELDHQMMEACVVRDTGKNDINMVINLFVINRMRQSYESNAPPRITSAHEWQQGGGDGAPETQVFGVTDLLIEQLAGNEDTNTIHYRADYTFWIPAGLVGQADNGFPLPYHRSDLITLVQQKKGWRISEIIRD